MNGAANSPEYLLEVKSVTKRFPGVTANDQVSLAVLEGEVHALLGENGAGKSTLCHILSGLYHPDEGEVIWRGRRMSLRSPRDALQAGIFMVHQHFRLVESFTVAENVVVAGAWVRERWRSARAIEDAVGKLADAYGIDVSPQARVWQLSLGERQRVELLRALYRDARLLLLDEPTSVLTPQEADSLFDALRHMSAEGRSVIFISHKLDEVVSVSDRVTVLRDGRDVATVTAKETTQRQLAGFMVGRPVSVRRRVRREVTVAQPTLELRAVSARGDDGRSAVNDITLAVAPGEIFGIAGIAGNGQQELAEVLAGLRPSTAGEVFLHGNALPKSVRKVADAGLAYIPEDRTATGTAPSLSVGENAALRTYRRRPIALGPIVRRSPLQSFAEALINEYDVRPAVINSPIRLLSGGNIQKVMIARELAEEPSAIVAMSPTHGLDVAATHAVRGFLLEAAERGAAILLISEDLDELMALTDRMGVLFGGRLVAVVATESSRIDEIGLMMAGATA